VCRESRLGFGTLAGATGGERRLPGRTPGHEALAWSAAWLRAAASPLGARPLGCLPTWRSSGPGDGGPAPSTLQPSLHPDLAQVLWSCPCCSRVCACGAGSFTQTCCRVAAPGGGSGDGTGVRGVVQPTRGAQILACPVVCGDAMPLPVPCLAQRSPPVTPDTKRTLHASPCKGWVTPRAKTRSREKSSTKMRGVPESRAKRLPQS